MNHLIYLLLKFTKIGGSTKYLQFWQQIFAVFTIMFLSNLKREIREGVLITHFCSLCIMREGVNNKHYDMTSFVTQTINRSIINIHRCCGRRTISLTIAN